MTALQERVEKLAQSDISILIVGESGTGKEIVARSIHEHSARDRKPFVALNCAAVAPHGGMFVEAEGGTLFLDEIGEMPLAVQARLLRVLQEREVRPVGGDGVRHVDVRVVAATNADLQESVDDRRFRADLYYRLNVATIEVPPLRARMSDVPELAAHFLHKHGGAREAQLTPAALDALMGYAWPGNVRELENAMLHALALTSGGTIDRGALPPVVTCNGAPRHPPVPVPNELGWTAEVSLSEAKKRAMAEFERQYVTRALERAGGNVTEAARASGLERSNFRRVLTRLGIELEPFRARRTPRHD